MRGRPFPACPGTGLYPLSRLALRSRPPSPPRCRVLAAIGRVASDEFPELGENVRVCWPPSLASWNGSRLRARRGGDAWRGPRRAAAGRGGALRGCSSSRRPLIAGADAGLVKGLPRRVQVVRAPQLLSLFGDAGVSVPDGGVECYDVSPFGRRLVAQPGPPAVSVERAAETGRGRELLEAMA